MVRDVSQPERGARGEARDDIVDRMTVLDEYVVVVGRAGRCPIMNLISFAGQGVRRHIRGTAIGQIRFIRRVWSGESRHAGVHLLGSGALGVAQQAISVAALDVGMFAAITRTLGQVNGYLAANGLQILTTTAVGATTANAGFGGSTYRLPGMDGAQTANPANTSGVVRSGER